MNIVLIIQARMSSTRLPGKILMEVLGQPLLSYQLERLKRAKWVNKIVLATTLSAADETVVSFCDRNGIPSFRGDEFDVLSRFYFAAKLFSADIVVRTTADCPLIDPGVVDKVIRMKIENPQLDYVSNTLDRTFPRGLDCEVFSFDALARAHTEATSSFEREHVTPFIHSNPGKFRLAQVLNSTNYSQHRWTVDTQEDFALIRKLLEALYPQHPNFTMDDCLEVLSRHPDWFTLNSHIQQKAH